MRSSPLLRCRRAPLKTSQRSSTRTPSGPTWIIPPTKRRACRDCVLPNLSIAEVLQSLPNIGKLLFKGSNEASLLTAGKQIVPDDLLSHLATIILSKDEEITEVGRRKNKDHIRTALVSMAKSTS